MADPKLEANDNETNGTSTQSDLSHSKEKNFEIHVKGQLNSHWSEWFEGLEMKYLDNGEMVLSGPIIDQAALMGIFNKLSRLNLALLSVNEVERKNELEEK